MLIVPEIALLRIHSLIEHEDLTPSYVVERLEFARRILIFGGAVSAFLIIIYTVIHVAHSRTKKTVVEH